MSELYLNESENFEVENAIKYNFSQIQHSSIIELSDNAYKVYSFYVSVSFNKSKSFYSIKKIACILNKSYSSINRANNELVEKKYIIKKHTNSSNTVILINKESENILNYIKNKVEDDKKNNDNSIVQKDNSIVQKDNLIVQKDNLIVQNSNLNNNNINNNKLTNTNHPHARLAGGGGGFKIRELIENYCDYHYDYDKLEKFINTEIDKNKDYINNLRAYTIKLIEKYKNDFRIIKKESYYDYEKVIERETNNNTCEYKDIKDEIDKIKNNLCNNFDINKKLR